MQHRKVIHMRESFLLFEELWESFRRGFSSNITLPSIPLNFPYFLTVCYVLCLHTSSYISGLMWYCSGIWSPHLCRRAHLHVSTNMYIVHCTLFTCMKYSPGSLILSVSMGLSVYLLHDSLLFRQLSIRTYHLPILTIYAPMIYTAPCVRFWIWADRLRGEVGGEGLALEIESFVGLVKFHKHYARGCINHRCINS